MTCNRGICDYSDMGQSYFPSDNHMQHCRFSNSRAPVINSAVDCSAIAGPALEIAICRENGHAMHEFTEISVFGSPNLLCEKDSGAVSHPVSNLSTGSPGVLLRRLIGQTCAILTLCLLLTGSRGEYLRVVGIHSDG